MEKSKTMNRICISLSILTGLLTLAPLSVVGAETTSSSLFQALKECTTVSDNMDRLACFDREMGNLSQANVTAPVKEPVDMASQEEKFGIVEKEKSDELVEIRATVVRVANRSNRNFTVLLDNDQIWRQRYTGGFQIKAGDEVTIIKGNFGGYNLELKGRREAVERVK